jgi:hypothetical protein
MTHTLSDGCQTFEFRPAVDSVTMIRRAPRPVFRRGGIKPGSLQVTGCFEMTRDEARKLWKSMVKDGAFAA